MIAMIVALLKTNAVGSLIGWIGGHLQRKVDLESKRLEFEHEKDVMTHELNMRDKDAAILQLELAGKERIASIEAEGKVESAALSAIAEGYKDQFEGGGKMAAFSRFIRPFATVYALVCSTVLVTAIIYLAWWAGALEKISIDKWYELLEYVVMWALFHCSVIIGWWFAMRSGQVPKFKKG